MSYSEDVTVSPSVDYLTVVTKSDREGAILIDNLINLKPSDFWLNTKYTRWSFHGFVGWAYEGVRYGLRGEEAIVMLSGDTCQALWQNIAPDRGKATRIDLAVTVRRRTQDTSVAREVYGEVLEAGGRTASTVMSSRGGATTYVGSRSSTQMARVYDKGSEQGGDPGFVWRYEIEAKKPLSELLVTRLLSTEDVPGFILSYTYDWFTSRGVSLPFTPTSTHDAIEVGASVQSDDKRLEWLRTQVRPTVGKLMVAGLEKDVYKALGLPGLEELQEKERLSKWQ